jgi:hypothetical protein
MVLASMARKVNALLHGFTFACFYRQKIIHCIFDLFNKKNPYTFACFFLMDEKIHTLLHDFFRRKVQIQPYKSVWI